MAVRTTAGTTAHLLDFIAASANMHFKHFAADGAQQQQLDSFAAGAAAAQSPAKGSIMDDDMQVIALPLQACVS